MFSSHGKGCSSESVQAVDRLLTPTTVRNSHPTGSAKGCRGAARDILVVALAGHNRRYGWLTGCSGVGAGAGSEGASSGSAGFVALVCVWRV